MHTDELLQHARDLESAQPERALALVQLALNAEPQSSLGWIAAALLHERLLQFDLACKAAGKVLSLQATPAERFDAACLLGRNSQSELALRIASLAFHDLGEPVSLAPMVLNIALSCADWALAGKLQTRLAYAYARGAYQKLRGEARHIILWCDDPRVNLRVIQAWGGLPKKTIESSPLAAPRTTTSQSRRLRIGYLSGDFRNHPTAWLLQGLLRNHNRQQFEIFLYCSSWDDGSSLRQEVVQWADHLHSISTLDDAAATAMIRSHQLDVLVDLSGPTRFNRLGILAQRAAPVQLSCLGFHGSLGLPGVDYILADPFTLPPEQRKYVRERVIYIEPTLLFNDCAAQPAPAPFTRVQAGLPVHAQVLGVFNAVNKITPEMWQTWMTLLQKHPNAVLWLLAPAAPIQQRLCGHALRAGITADRLHWAPRCDRDTHLARLRCCDLMLDTWPHGGHTTTVDALFAGVPVLTRTGRNMTSRLSGSLVRAAGLEELVCDTLKSYGDKADALLRNPDQLQQMRQRLAVPADRLPVFNARRQTQCLEAAYRHLAQRGVRSCIAL